jgi:hypothetical protein
MRIEFLQRRVLALAGKYKIRPASESAREIDRRHGE